MGLLLPEVLSAIFSTITCGNSFSCSCCTGYSTNNSSTVLSVRPSLSSALLSARLIASSRLLSVSSISLKIELTCSAEKPRISKAARSIANGELRIT